MKKCSRCKSDDYRVCSRDCQAKDWKRHKRSQCYEYDKEQVAHAREVLRQDDANQTCPICVEPFTVSDLMRHFVMTFQCKHRIHTACAAQMSHHEEASYRTGKKTDTNLHACPLCRQFIGPTTHSSTPWFREDPLQLLRSMLGYCFQLDANGEGSVQDEMAFIEGRLQMLRNRSTNPPKTDLQLTLDSLEESALKFEELLPQLRASRDMQQHQAPMMRLKAKLSVVLLPALIPDFLTSREPLPETDKFLAHLRCWMDSLQLDGPYVWA